MNKLLDIISMLNSLKFLARIFNFRSIMFQFWTKTSQELVFRIIPKQCDQ